MQLSFIRQFESHYIYIDICESFLKKLSILLDCGLPDVESGAFFNKKNSIFWQNESLNKHSFITFWEKIHQLVNLVNLINLPREKKTLVVVASLTYPPASF